MNKISNQKNKTTDRSEKNKTTDRSEKNKLEHTSFCEHLRSFIGQSSNQASCMLQLNGSGSGHYKLKKKKK